MLCKQCNQELTIIRSTKRYCSSNCRVRAFRRRGGKASPRREFQEKVAKSPHAPFDICPKHSVFYQSCGCI